MADYLFIFADVKMKIMEEEKTINNAAEEQNEGQAAAQEQQEVKEQAPQKGQKSEKNARKEAQKEIQALKDQVKELTEKVEKEKQDYLRLMAEFETFRRRSAEEKLNIVGTASADTIKGLLPVLDDCGRAMEILAGSSDEAAKEGTALILDKLMGYLKTKGLAVIEAKGTKFDTDFHEAVTQFPVQDESQKGMVIDVVQTGYTLNGKVIRYAKVVVGA